MFHPSVSIRRQIPPLAALLLAGTAHLAEAQNPDLTYHPVAPCTIVDTRSGTPFAPGEIRTYTVVGSASLASQGGSATGCGIPGFSNGIAQTQAVALVFTAISPSGGGNIAAHAADQPLAGSILNLVAGTTPTNTTPVAVAQTSGVGDIKVQASFSGTHLLIRAVGYYAKDVQTVHVHPVPGDHTASGTVLLNALAGITNASATKRYVIKLEPGIFDLGSTRLIMKPYVDIEGSGQEASVIQGGGSGDLWDGVIWGASFAELRQLQVKSTGASSSQFAIPVFLPEGAATRLTNVTLAGSGGGGNYGLRAAGGSPWIEEATIRVQGGEIGYGIVSLGTSRLTVKRTLIEVTGSSIESDGILLASTAYDAEVRDVQITAASSGTSYGIRHREFAGGGLRLTSSTINAEDYGIESSPGSIFIENSQVRATGSNSTGVYAPFATVTVDHSEIAGVSYTVFAGSAQIGATRLHGGPASAVGTAVCALVYDESFAPFVGPFCP